MSVVHVLVLIYRGLEWLEFPVSCSSTLIYIKQLTQLQSSFLVLIYNLSHNLRIW